MRASSFASCAANDGYTRKSIKRRNLLHPHWVLLDVISVGDYDGVRSRLSCFALRKNLSNDVPEQIKSEFHKSVRIKKVSDSLNVDVGAVSKTLIAYCTHSIGDAHPAKDVPMTRPRPKVIPAASNPKMTCLIPE